MAPPGCAIAQSRPARLQTAKNAIIGKPMKRQQTPPWRSRRLAALWTVLVVGAAAALLWREIWEIQVGKVEPGMAGITLPEVLNVRITSPLLAENNPGLGAALLAHLARVCRELPRKEQVTGCLAIVAPNPEQTTSTKEDSASTLPEELRNFTPVKAFIQQWSRGLPAAIPGRVVSLTNDIRGWTAGRIENTSILWLRPKDELRSSCGFLPRPLRLNPLDAVPFLRNIAQAVAPAQGKPEPVQIPGLGPANIGRVYVLFSTGDIVIEGRPANPDQSDESAAKSELKRWKTLESRPCFAQASYYTPPFSPAFRNSSPYLDRAGLGFNITITGPPRDNLGIAMVPGMDITFDPQSLAGPMGRFAALVSVDEETPSWKNLATALQNTAKREKPELAERVEKCANHQGATTPNDRRFLQCPEQLADVEAYTIAMHLGGNKWLIAIPAPEPVPGWPFWVGPLLAAGLLAGIFWLVFRARQTEHGSEALVDAFDRLDVPILITDPNSDIIRGANASARERGFVPRKKFVDIVEEAAQSQYQTNQPVGQERRGYGTRIKNTGHPGMMDAIVRSADVRAEVEHLGASPGDRLALILPLEADSDLYWIQADLRQQFAELLDHGIVALIHGLDVLIAVNPALAQDVFRLLIRNQKFILALFSSPDKRASSDVNDAIVLRDGFDVTLSVLRRVFLAAAAQLELREMLGLEGGTLDGLSQAPPEVFREDIQWPNGLALRVHLPGAIGFFTTEALRNALRHGEPGSIPFLEVRPEGLHMSFTVRNTARNKAIPEVRRKQGGIQLMKMAADRLGWEFYAGSDTADETQFLCYWVVKVIQAKPA
jgi:hypothetical protein